MNKYKKRLIEVIINECKKTKQQAEKSGEITYNDGRKINLQLHSDIAVGYNQAISDIITKLKTLIK